MSIKTNLTAAFIAIAAAGTANATTIDPSDFDSILTESYRTATVGGVDISGNAAVDGNLGIDDFDMGDFPSATLIAGRVALSGRGKQGIDEWSFADVTGPVEVALTNFGRSSRKGNKDYTVTFQVLIDDVVAATRTLSGLSDDSFTAQDGFSFGVFDLTGQKLSFMAIGVEGATDYDTSFLAAPRTPAAALAPVPLPAGGLMLLAGLGGLAAMRRRKQQG